MLLIYCNLLAWNFDNNFLSVFQELSFSNSEQYFEYLKKYYDFSINFITLNHSRIRLGNSFNYPSTSFLTKEKNLENPQIYSNDLECLHAFGSNNIIITTYINNANNPQNFLILIRNQIGVFSYTSSQIYPKILIQNPNLSLSDEKEFKLIQNKIIVAEQFFQDIPNYDYKGIIDQYDLMVTKIKEE